MRLAHWLHSSFRSAYLTSRRDLQGVPRHGAARRSGSSFPEIYLFFSNRFRRSFENQVVPDTRPQDLDAPWKTRENLYEKSCRIA
jgi:hypothetical protein